MIILRQKEFGFLTPKKDQDELWRKVQDYKKYNSVDLPSKTKQYLPDFKCWLGFLDSEVNGFNVKKQIYGWGKDEHTIIYIYCLDYVLRDNIIASNEFYSLVYDDTKKSYKVIYGAVQIKNKFIQKALKKLDKEQGKVCFECKTVLEGLDWMRKHLITIYL